MSRTRSTRRLYRLAICCIAVLPRFQKCFVSGRSRTRLHLIRSQRHQFRYTTLTYRPVVKMQDFQSRVSPFHLIASISAMVGVEPTISIIGTTFALRAPYRIRTDPYCLEGSRAKPLTLMMHTIYLGPQRVELCVSAYKTDAQRPSSTSPMFHSTQSLYRTSYSAGFFSLMKLSGYCELPLIDLLWGHGLHHPLSSSFA